MYLPICAVYTHKAAKNEQNLATFQGERQLEFIELFEVQTPPVTGGTFSPGGHPQTPGNRGNADEETSLPGEQDRAGAYDSQEEWHKKQAGRPAGLEEEEALGAAAHADRWHALHHRVSEGSFGEFTHQHGGPEEHGLCRQGHEEGPREHGR